MKQADEQPLLPRLAYAGRPLIRLTEDQRRAIERFRAACDDGSIRFEPANCVCGSPRGAGKLLATQDRYGLPVHTHLCRRCGMLWTSPRMTRASLNHFYAHHYRGIYTGRQNADDAFYLSQQKQGKRLLNYIHPAFRRPRDRRPVVLDIGCGAGGMLAPLRQDGWQAAGCDLGADYLDRGRREGLELHQGDWRTLSHLAGADLVIASHVLEHCPDPISELRGWASLLRPGGMMYVELPGVFQSYWWYGDFGFYLQNAHLYHFSLATLAVLLSRAGLSPVKGDEFIHGLFVKDDCPARSADPWHAGRVERYLLDAEAQFLAGTLQTRLTTTPPEKRGGMLLPAREAA